MVKYGISCLTVMTIPFLLLLLFFVCLVFFFFVFVLRCFAFVLFLLCDRTTLIVVKKPTCKHVNGIRNGFFLVIYILKLKLHLYCNYTHLPVELYICIARNKSRPSILIKKNQGLVYRCLPLGFVRGPGQLQSPLEKAT